jgi:hypothetical protein
VRSPLHFHPTLDLCAFSFMGTEGEEEEEGGGGLILEGTDPLASRDVVGGEPLVEAEVPDWMSMH